MKLKYIDILLAATNENNTITIITYIINAYYNVGSFKMNTPGRRLRDENPTFLYSLRNIISDFLIYSTTPNEEFCRTYDKKVRNYIEEHDITIQAQTISDIIKDLSDYYYNNVGGHKFLQE